MTKSYAILEAPSPLGLHPEGVQDAPVALLQAGLAEGLNATVAGRVEPSPYDPERDRESGVLNPGGIARYAVDLADRIVPIVEAGAIPVVLGGDCSILLGCALAMRRLGRTGLLFVDGHADFYQAEAEPNGEVASMELGFLTGRGAAILADIEGRSPLVPDEDIVVFGRRDSEDVARFGSRRVEETDIPMVDLGEIRRTGLDASLKRAFGSLSRPELDGFWLHIDVDVLDEEIMPAVDSPQPGGLGFAELTAVLGSAVATGRLRGVNVTIFNPRMDPDGSITADLTKALVKGLYERPLADGPSVPMVDDPIESVRIEHRIDEMTEDGTFLYRYNYLDYHFEGSRAYCRARVYADDFSQIVIFGPFESIGNLQEVAAPEFLATVTSYLGRRFKIVSTSAEVYCKL